MIRRFDIFWRIVFINHAIAIKLIDIQPDEYGYTTIVPGFGFLADKYTSPFVANWKLNRREAVSEQVPGVRSVAFVAW